MPSLELPSHRMMHEEEYYPPTCCQCEEPIIDEGYEFDGEIHCLPCVLKCAGITKVEC